MIRPFRSMYALSFLTAFGLLSAEARGADFYGLMRSRDLTPFGFLRLDMRPGHAMSIKPGTFALETEVGYQNTWALSPNVEGYLTSLEASGRRELGPADLEAIRALPGENYLVDIESAAVDITLHYKLSDLWTAYVITSGVSYSGGFLDSSIESFHDAFGFSSFGRPSSARNEVNLIYDLKSTQFASFGSPSNGGFTDPTIGVRYVGLGLPEPWHLSMEAAAKIPVSGERALLSTGRTDYGAQAAIQRRGQNHALYVDLAAVYYAGASFPIPQDSKVIPTIIVGYERAVTARTNVVIQGYASTSVYSHKETDLEDLLDNKYQLTLGVHHRRDEFLVSFGFTENLQNYNNTPDVAFQLGLSYIPTGRWNRDGYRR